MTSGSLVSGEPPVTSTSEPSMSAMPTDGAAHAVMVLRPLHGLHTPSATPCVRTRHETAVPSEMASVPVPNVAPSSSASASVWSAVCPVAVAVVSESPVTSVSSTCHAVWSLPCAELCAHARSTVSPIWASDSVATVVGAESTSASPGTSHMATVADE